MSVEGKSWDLSAEYSSADGPEMAADRARLDEVLDSMAALNVVIEPLLADASKLAVGDATEAIEAAQKLHALVEEAGRLIADPQTYAECRLSVDGADTEARELLGRLNAPEKRFLELAEPLSQFLELCSDAVVDAYLLDESVAASAFAVRHARARRHEILPLREENLVSALGQDGVHAWGRLYDTLSGTISCEVSVGNESRGMGLAEAFGLMETSDDRVREAAWRGVNTAWEGHAESCAAALNAISGWRLELCRKRSGGRPVHYLDAPVHMNRLSRATLDTVLEVAAEFAPLARRAAKLQARAYGKRAYGPWDQRAPAPDLPAAEARQPVPYGDAVALIADSYSQVDREMGDFVRMMAERCWIEGTVGERKRPGAYCTGFRKSRTPRVYMTYAGSSSDIITLAHELGHGYHSWVMRDLPDSQRRYGMSIAETASTFGETIVRDALKARATDDAEELAIGWEETSALIAFVLNIPTRFEFERNFYDARAERPQRPEELQAMMSAAWRKWYDDSLAEPDPMFWASKLHFYISELSFYNFPYLFGYLFSLGVYARRESFGDDFFPRYKALLRDTGRTTAEELAARHLEADITQADFWRDTLLSLEPLVDDFETLVGRLVPAA